MNRREVANGDPIPAVGMIGGKNSRVLEVRRDDTPCEF